MFNEARPVKETLVGMAFAVAIQRRGSGAPHSNVVLRSPMDQPLSVLRSRLTASILDANRIVTITSAPSGPQFTASNLEKTKDLTNPDDIDRILHKNPNLLSNYIQLCQKSSIFIYHVSHFTIFDDETVPRSNATSPVL